VEVAVLCGKCCHAAAYLLRAESKLMRSVDSACGSALRLNSRKRIWYAGSNRILHRKKGTLSCGMAAARPMACDGANPPAKMINSRCASRTASAAVVAEAEPWPPPPLPPSEPSPLRPSMPPAGGSSSPRPAPAPPPPLLTHSVQSLTNFERPLVKSSFPIGPFQSPQSWQACRRLLGASSP